MTCAECMSMCWPNTKIGDDNLKKTSRAMLISTCVLLNGVACADSLCRFYYNPRSDTGIQTFSLASRNVVFIGYVVL